MRTNKIVCAMIITIFLFLLPAFVSAVDLPDFDPLTNTEDLAGELNTTASFAAGTGRSAGMTTSSFPGLKIGAGATMILNPGSLQDLQSLDTTDPEQVKKLVSAFPTFFSNVFVKLGLPSLDIPLLKTTDVGVHLGLLPLVDLGQNVSVVTGKKPTIETSAFQVGAEFRTVLVDLSIFNLDLRGSFDYYQGSSNVGAPIPLIDDKTMTVGYDNNWSGSSIGLRSLAGIDINWIFGIRGGAGINFNFGKTNSTFYAESSDEQINNLIQTAIGDIKTSTTSFDPFDVRVMAGIKLLIIDVYAEYGLISQRFAATIMPVTLKFF